MARSPMLCYVKWRVRTLHSRTTIGGVLSLVGLAASVYRPGWATVIFGLLAGGFVVLLGWPAIRWARRPRHHGTGEHASDEPPWA